MDGNEMGGTFSMHSKITNAYTNLVCKSEGRV